MPNQIETELRANCAAAIAGQLQMEAAGTHGEGGDAKPAPSPANITEIPDYAARFRQMLRNALTNGSADYIMDRIDVIRSLIAKCDAATA